MSWSPMRSAGFSAAEASCGTYEMVPPRMRRSAMREADSTSAPSMSTCPPAILAPRRW